MPNVKNCTGILIKPNLLNQPMKQYGMRKKTYNFIGEVWEHIYTFIEVI